MRMRATLKLTNGKLSYIGEIMLLGMELYGMELSDMKLHGIIWYDVGFCGLEGNCVESN